jgi:predicted Zn-dependent protease
MQQFLKQIGRLLMALCLTLGVASSAYAMATVRDAEIETTIRKLATPIFKTAGLVPENITIIIVNDPQINAFVAGGMNLFIHTGLLMQFDKPEVLLGTIAHETGHISGGHLARNSDKFKNISLGTAMSYGLGAVAAALGSPDVGMAVLQGGTQAAQRTMLQYSRENEESADQAALNFLDRTHNSASGLLELLEYLNREEHALYGNLNPYTLTHPLSRERIAHIRNHVGVPSTEGAGTISVELRRDYVRSYVKLHAFFDPAQQTLKKYPQSNKTVNARYARAIAYQKIPDLDKSFKELDSLIAEYPADPYFAELKGQILFENGRALESVQYYKKAVQLLPSQSQLVLGLAMAEIAAADGDMAHSKQLLPAAINSLNDVHLKEPANMMVLEQLEIAYGKSGMKGMSYWAHAEQALLANNKNDARKFAHLAEKYLSANSPSAMRVKDMLKNLDLK